MIALQVAGLEVTYGRERVVHGVSFDVKAGQTLGLVGESGSGKSSVAAAIVGLVEPSNGTISVDGMNVLERSRRARAYRRRAQLVFQNPAAALDPRMSVGDSIAEATAATGHRWSKADKVARVRDLLEHVQIDPHRAKELPGSFSGGERQRVTIARALAGEPSVLIADEVTSALDVSVQGAVLNLLRALQRELDLAIVFISHNLAAVRYLSDDIVVMRAGEVVERGKTDALVARPQHGYTQQLLEAVPELGVRMTFSDR